MKTQILLTAVREDDLVLPFCLSYTFLPSLLCHHKCMMVWLADQLTSPAEDYPREAIPAPLPGIAYCTDVYVLP